MPLPGGRSIRSLRVPAPLSAPGYRIWKETLTTGLKPSRRGEGPPPSRSQRCKLLFVRCGLRCFLVKARSTHCLSRPTRSFPSGRLSQQGYFLYLYTVGRVDRKATGPKAPDPFGTGFLLTPELFLTNHHVVTKITDGTDIIDPGTVEVRFVQEYGAPDEPAVPVLEVYGFHPDEDAAILRLARSAVLESRKPLLWSTSPLVDGANVVVVGYPSADSRNPLFVDTIFGGKLSVKRLAPGQFIGTKRGALFHDCSTLGGNSGSPLVDMTTGAVVGLHRDGSFLARNEAVGLEALGDFVRV